MTILNLVIRPVTCVILCRVASERGGGDFAGRGTFGDIFGMQVLHDTNMVNFQLFKKVLSTVFIF